MNEADQILAALTSVEFWLDNRRRRWSTSIPGGLSLEIGRKGLEWTWSITRRDGTRWLSALTFPTMKAAKENLREELDRRMMLLECLPIYEERGRKIADREATADRLRATN
jgi:hypothetical protein